jgi:hypothetical protein
MSQFKKYLEIVTEGKNHFYNEETQTIKQAMEDLHNNMDTTIDTENPGVGSFIDIQLRAIKDSLEELTTGMSNSKKSMENYEQLEDLKKFIYSNALMGKMNPITSDLVGEIKKLIPLAKKPKKQS